MPQSADRTLPFATPNKARGLLVPGNIDLGNRPILHNPDGTVSSERSFSIGTDQGEVLIPRVFDGKDHTEKEAIDHYKQTGQHMGIFDNPQDADGYAQAIHNRRMPTLVMPQNSTKPSTLKTIGSEVWDQLFGGPIEMAKHAYNTTMSPARLPGDNIINDVATNMAHGAWNELGKADEYAKAAQRSKTPGEWLGNTSQSFGHLGASALPGAGPVAAQAGE